MPIFVKAERVLIFQSFTSYMDVLLSMMFALLKTTETQQNYSSCINC